MIQWDWKLLVYNSINHFMHRPDYAKIWPLFFVTHFWTYYVSLYHSQSDRSTQLALFKDKNVLVAGEAEDLFPVELSEHCRSVSVFTTNYGYYRQLASHSAISCDFAVEISPPQSKADLVLLYWPKAKAEADYLLAMLFATLGAGTEIVVVGGENRSGVKSIEKMFAPYGRVIKHDSARRCSLYWGGSVNMSQLNLNLRIGIKATL